VWLAGGAVGLTQTRKGPGKVVIFLEKTVSRQHLSLQAFVTE